MRRPWGLPLVPLYWAGMAAKNALYECRWLRVRRLSKPVISVGSLSAGGAGKTPIVIALAKLLIRHGIRPDVLSRGYGRNSTAVEEVPMGGSPEQFGDEPVEIRRHRVRVLVGADRFAAGRLSESSYGGDVDVHLLDDGAQHRRLGRNLEVLLLTREDMRDHLLPAGNLREPLRSLRRADVVVLREEEAEELRPAVQALTAAEIWIVRRRLIVPSQQTPQRWYAFCAIARPEGFVEMLQQSGVEIVGSRFFPDHYAYRAEDLTALATAARAAGADGLCTTWKDYTKIPQATVQELLKICPLMPLRLRATLLDEDAAVRRIRAAMKGA